MGGFNQDANNTLRPFVIDNQSGNSSFNSEQDDIKDIIDASDPEPLDTDQEAESNDDNEAADERKDPHIQPSWQRIRVYSGKIGDQ